MELKSSVGKCAKSGNVNLGNRNTKKPVTLSNKPLPFGVCDQPFPDSGGTPNSATSVSYGLGSYFEVFEVLAGNSVCTLSPATVI